MKKNRSLTSIIFPKGVGFIVFILILLAANFLGLFVGNQFYKDSVNFFNLNIGLLIVILFVDIINEIFWDFDFPFNLLAPVISSIFWIVTVTFLYNLWKFIDAYVLLGIEIPIYTIYILVAIIAFVFGYVHIFSTLNEPRKNKNLEEIRTLSCKKKNSVEWNDVEAQFKILFAKVEEQVKIILYNLLDALNKHIEINNHKGKKK